MKPIHIHVLLVVVLSFAVVQCYGLEFFRRNPGVIDAHTRAIILNAMLDLIRSINRNAHYYTGLTFVDMSMRTDDGSLVSVTIRTDDLVELWYSKLGICSIFPSWGVMQPWLTLQYNFMRLFWILSADPGNYANTEVTQGRYTLSYEIEGTENLPSMYEMHVACSNCSTSASKNTTISKIETTEIDDGSLHAAGNWNWEATELAMKSLQDENMADCWIYKCCITSRDHDSPLSRLETGQVLKSPTGRYYLIMQEDCNLVLYMGKEDPVWASQTQNEGIGCFLRMQMDGNLVIYDGAFNVVWSYNKFCRKPCWLPYAMCVEDYGQVAVCNIAEQTCIWSSKA